MAPHQQLNILADMGRFEESLQTTERALPLVRSAGDRINEAIVLMNIGDCQLTLGRLEDARRSTEAARRAIARSNGSPGSPAP